MHMVLLGVDLLRMHNNKPYFKGTQCRAGFLEILSPTEQQQQQQKQGQEDAGSVHLEFIELHDLSDKDLYSLAALMATLLLHWRMWQEGALPPEVQHGVPVAGAAGMSTGDKIRANAVTADKVREAALLRQPWSA